MTQPSQTAIIVIHEIYGVNAHIKKVCESLSALQFDVFCPNLLGRNHYEYVFEKEAYRNFHENIGIDQGADVICNFVDSIKDRYQHIFILGFSVGASIAWLCSENKGVSGVIGYYGSRIRDFVEMEPLCPALLFFPVYEESFDVKEFVSQLVKKKNVDAHICNGNHGFSDPFSKEYHSASAIETWKKTVHFLKSHV